MHLLLHPPPLSLLPAAHSVSQKCRSYVRLPRTLVTDYQPELLQHADTAAFRIQLVLLPPCACDTTQETPAAEVIDLPASTRLRCARIPDAHASLGYYVKLRGLNQVLPGFVVKEGWFCAGKHGLATLHLLQASSIHTPSCTQGLCSIEVDGRWQAT